MNPERNAWLFLCVANSARSQMAEGWGRAMAPVGVEVFSAGSDPGRLNPAAVQAMAEVGIDLSGHHSKPISDIPAERVARVITLCAEEVCPVFPGEVERLHWPLEDPAGVEGSTEVVLDSFRRVRDQIRERLEALIDGDA